MLFHITQGIFIVPKCHRCTHLCSLWHHASQKSEVFKFLTLYSKPWQMMAVINGSHVFKNILWVSGQHSVVLWIELCLLNGEYFFVWKNDFTLLRCGFQQLPIKIRSLSLLKDCKILTLLWFQMRKLEISFYSCPQLFWVHFKNQEPFFSRRVLMLLFVRH